MNNAYYILAKKAIQIERLHICTWEFPDTDSYIEFGIEFSYEYFENKSLDIWLSVPFIREQDEVNCLLKNLVDSANGRFIFNDIVRDCREMSKKFFGFFNELIDKVIEIS